MTKEKEESSFFGKKVLEDKEQTSKNEDKDWRVINSRPKIKTKKCFSFVK